MRAVKTALMLDACEREDLYFAGPHSRLNLWSAPYSNTIRQRAYPYLELLNLRAQEDFSAACKSWTRLAGVRSTPALSVDRHCPSRS